MPKIHKNTRRNYVFIRRNSIDNHLTISRSLLSRHLIEILSSSPNRRHLQRTPVWSLTAAKEHGHLVVWPEMAGVWPEMAREAVGSVYHCRHAGLTLDVTWPELQSRVVPFLSPGFVPAFFSDAVWYSNFKYVINFANLEKTRSGWFEFNFVSFRHTERSPAS